MIALTAAAAKEELCHVELFDNRDEMYAVEGEPKFSKGELSKLHIIPR